MIETREDLATALQPLAEWSAITAEIDDIVPIADLKTGGVNRGDRRAIYHLIRFLRPTNVLEIGTHVGASTSHIAAALRTNGAGELTTVDIDAVNSPDGPWSWYGLRYPPVRLVECLGMAGRTRFIREASVDFLGQTPSDYDFIFLDGDHQEPTVYQELLLALPRLRAGGTILLHDYFPDGKPLWKDGAVIPGPFDACARLRAEGVSFDLLPLGELPWDTKFGSRVTSLALAVKKI